MSEPRYKAPPRATQFTPEQLIGKPARVIDSYKVAHAGLEGTIIWAGHSKGRGRLRVGIKTARGQTYFLRAGVVQIPSA